VLARSRNKSSSSSSSVALTSAHFALQDEILVSSLKAFLLLIAKVNHNKGSFFVVKMIGYQELWSTQFQHDKCAEVFRPSEILKYSDTNLMTGS